MESMDTYRFGGASLDSSEKAAMISKTLELITELSKTKKGKMAKAGISRMGEPGASRKIALVINAYLQSRR
jgi:hypothetical protein